MGEFLYQSQWEKLVLFLNVNILIITVVNYMGLLIAFIFVLVGKV